MKEIKFRAYWKVVNEFRYFDSPKLTCDAMDKGTYGMFLPSNDGSVFMGSTTPQMFTGFQDKNGTDIYDGDILSDWKEVDGEMVQSKMQVFWCDKVGAWKLDNSYSQDKSSGDLLSDELAGFAYEVTGHINER